MDHLAMRGLRQSSSMLLCGTVDTDSTGTQSDHEAGMTSLQLGRASLLVFPAKAGLS